MSPEAITALTALGAALIAALSALAGSWLQRRWSAADAETARTEARQAEHESWLREKRIASYADVMSAASAYVRAFRIVGVPTDEQRAVLLAALDDADGAVDLVRLVGSQAAAKAGDVILVALLGAHRLAREAIKSKTPVDGDELTAAAATINSALLAFADNGKAELTEGQQPERS